MCALGGVCVFITLVIVNTQFRKICIEPRTREPTMNNFVDTFKQFLKAKYDAHLRAFTM